MISLHELFKHYGIDPKEVKLVRHGNSEIPILDTFRSNIDKLEAYQSIQNPKKFAGAKYIAVFSPSTGTASLFLGIWEIAGSVKSKDYSPKIHAMINRYNFPQSWHEEESEYYK
ncbi:MAG: hypothetical protein HN366_27910, partial [Deltaproteobacteria bacterium]|nr:hypothetical protein [Deltaproteobacteria bacterium]